MTEIWEPHAPTAGGGLRPLHAEGLDLRVGGTGTARAVGDGVVEVTAEGSGPVRIEWRVPCVDATAFWTPEPRGTGWLPAAWSAPRRTSLANGAPIAALVGTGDVALCAFAAERPDVLAGAGVVEETGEFRFWAQAEGRLTVRIDTSGRHFARCLTDLTDWWGDGRTVDIPDAARRPAYSTWYSMHQDVTPERVETQAALGKRLGLDVIIVDDGWMTADRTRGYAHCGDWEPVSLPDTAAHVERVHGLGVRYLLWYALPFIGKDSAAYQKLGRYALADAAHMGAIVADPRYPEVREFLTDRLVRAVEEWGMDGLKVDFVDWFARAEAPEAGPEADCARVDEGVERLLAAIRGRITAADPEAMVEYRQPYVSPGLWPYVTMIRATDCPLSPQENRQRTVDVRLAAGPVPVHSDMLMWHPGEPPEQVACHLINVLFSVPQISVDLAAQSPAQREAIAFWLGVFREHLDTLQLGELRPARPDLGYPMVSAVGPETVAVARYAALPVDASGEGWRTLLVANADADPQVRLTGADGTATATVQDARGRIVRQGEVELGRAEGILVPRGGLLTLRRP
ncbi:glycoside hydrolase family 36 protein [Kitasatospora sp. SUK 42]|uniref:glycoside hydrolase family 36 protein n=1 Tax=Kitasatospora sp. SUK 42 TaxID=1588882 RepID=UPI0018C935C8|nr:glycoside hydrolase family 36 protein [Kitasatospora sp. SUK 42]MBV2156715.1 alpha-galactosidase [Kitasatospora sp. SUK 42]